MTALAGWQGSGDDSDDGGVVQRALGGDRDAFGVLVHRYQRLVFRIVGGYLANRADVEETTQEVFINVFSSLGSFRAEAPFAAWVLGVARNTIAARFKRKQHPTVPLETNEDGEVEARTESPHHETTPLDYYELHERLRQLESAVERELSP